MPQSIMPATTLHPLQRPSFRSSSTVKIICSLLVDDQYHLLSILGSRTPISCIVAWSPPLLPPRRWWRSTILSSTTIKGICSLFLDGEHQNCVLLSRRHHLLPLCRSSAVAVRSSIKIKMTYSQSLN